MFWDWNRLAQLFQKSFFHNLDAMFVDNSLRFIARDFHVDFWRLVPSRDFETSSRTVQGILVLRYS